MEKHREKHRETNNKLEKSDLKQYILQLQKEKDLRRGKSDAAIRRTEMLQTNPLKYYKEFSKKPKDFKELYASSSEDEEISSSEEESDSSDDFPSPNSPRRGNKQQSSNIKDELYSKVQKLQQRLYEMEIENKKLRTYIRKFK